MATGQEVRRFGGHRGWVASVGFSPDGRLLASGSFDTTVLLWDVTAISPSGRLPVRRLSDAELRALWDDLAGTDVPQAHRAVWSLAAAADQAVPWLRAQLRPVPKVDAQHVTRLVADLDSDRFLAREKAMGELHELRELAEPEVRKALARNPSAELRRRIVTLHEGWELMTLSAGELRSLRAVTALEQMGTPAAAQLLRSLAQGEAAHRLSQEAKASLQRLAKRSTDSR